ncbi:MAG: hypothetical protein K940chlam3_00556 [Chlamydiae bacterium]|nr:hypothetical protein [Chlamydiota bacterium]
MRCDFPSISNSIYSGGLLIELLKIQKELVPYQLYFAKWDCVKAPGLNDRKWVHIY